jgi:hypothetical protein
MKTYKVALTGNLQILNSTGVWGFPLNGSPHYSKIRKNLQVGDKLIFTSRGEPVATTTVRTAPNEDLQMIFPNKKVYGNIFTVDTITTGRMNRAAMEKNKISFKRALVSESDTTTFQKVTTHLAKKSS